MDKASTLIIGSTGLIGPYLMKEFSLTRKVFGVSKNSSNLRLNVTDNDAVRQLIKKIKPNVVIYAAGFTNVDECEKHPEKAYEINRDGVENIVRATAPDTKIVYISTDQVYPDGKGLHKEKDAAPINTYGKSKYEGEIKALTHENSIILRMNFFGESLTAGRISLSDFIIDALKRKKQITLFDDIFFSPLHITSVVHYIIRCIDANLKGVYNLGSNNGMSKKDFAWNIAKHKGLSLDNTKSGSGVRGPLFAPRPGNMQMDVTKIESALGEKMPLLKNEIERL